MTTFFTALALTPKRSLVFLIREYLEPLSNGERLLVAATFLASFVSANGVQARLAAAYGPTVGWVGAIAIEAVYLGAALAGTSTRHRSRWQFASIWAVLLLAATLAITFNLAHEQEARRVMDAYIIAEAAGFPLLSILCAVLSHGLASERLAVVERRQETEHQREQAAQDTQRALEQQYKQRRIQIELDAQEQERAVQLEAHRAEQSERVKALRRELRVRGSVRGEQSTNSGAGVRSASDSAKAIDRAVLKERLANRLREQPDANRSALARELGIGRTLFYELLREVEV